VVPVGEAGACRLAWTQLQAACVAWGRLESLQVGDPTFGLCLPDSPQGAKLIFRQRLSDQQLSNHIVRLPNVDAFNKSKELV
jgi:hypothetical protein